ncbi:MAG: TRAP transporter small permease subunit [Rhodobacteraceae bacterium]|nr:TRAP transporter small permease subunit [Paracoccaceae bacterium]
MLFGRIETLMTRISIGLALIGGLGLIFATVLTCISIILKMIGRVANRISDASAPSWAHSILGEEELVQLAVGFALFAVLPYVMMRRGHVTIDLFAPVFGRLGNRILTLLGEISLAVIAYLLMTRQWFLIFKKARRDDDLWGELFIRGDWAEIGDRLRDSQISQIIGLPLWPTYIVAEFCTVIFFMVAVFCVIRATRDLFSKLPVRL